MVFQCINIRKKTREVLKTVASGLSFQHLPQDPVNINAWKTMFDPIIKGSKASIKARLPFQLFKCILEGLNAGAKITMKSKSYFKSSSNSSTIFFLAILIESVLLFQGQIMKIDSDISESNNDFFFRQLWTFCHNTEQKGRKGRKGKKKEMTVKKQKKY